jgi:DNA-binding MarR family transcriptional regulator
MIGDSNSDTLLGVLLQTFIAIIRSDGRDLSARQFAVFLTVYLKERDHTVRGLAAELGIRKPSITLALNRLEELELAKRAPDRRDRRSVLVVRTAKGNALLRSLRNTLASARSESMASEPDVASGSTKLAGSEDLMFRRPRAS